MALKKKEKPPSSLDDYCLDRLFDPEELYYTPMDELIKRYKKRNLRPGRIYNLGKKYGNVPETRVRVIQAPQMERAGQRIFGTENFYYPPPKVYYCTEPKPKKEIKTNKFSELSLSSSASDEDFDDDSSSENEYMTFANYKEWIEKRRKLRSGLNKLDLRAEYLKNKKDLTEVEKRVLYQLVYVDKNIQTDPISLTDKRSYVNSRQKSPVPKIKYPTPIAMNSIEEFLKENKWRLVDLFKDLDKNKDWKVKKDDFIRECKRGRLDISDSMIEELVVALGVSKSNKINYKALAKGRTSHLFDRRNQLRESRESLNSDEFIPIDIQRELNKEQEKKSKDRRKSSSPDKANISQNEFSESPSKSRNSSAMSLNYLQLPKIDTRPAHYPSNEKIERAISVASTLKNTPLQTRAGNRIKIKSETIKSLNAIKDKTEYDYAKCLAKTKSVQFENNSSLLNALVPPRDKDPDDIIHGLKEKSDEKKREHKQALKEAKLRKKLKNSLKSD